VNDALPLPAGGIPPGIHCAQDYAHLAARHLPAPTLAYLAGGSGQDRTAAANTAAFDAWQLLPRLLRELGHGHLGCKLGDQALAHPLLLAPMAFQRLAHPQGELACAQGAAATDTPFVCSTLSSVSLEDLAQAGQGPRWFQLYLQPRREDSLDLLRRAEAAGCRAIMLTLDASIQAPSLQALRAGFVMPAECRPANLQAYPAAEPRPLAPGQHRIFQGLLHGAPGWADLNWLLAQTRLPIWVKGVMHPQDALALRQRGVAGLVVSNHGGRCLDGVPASLAVLPAIRAAVGPDCPLLLDGGIRSGSDVFKALALGANAVMLGRLALYALSVAGALGVAHLIRLLCEELALAMAVTGCATPDEIRPDTLLRQGTDLRSCNPRPCPC
jgi:4-hydroxymandelate oxidase